MIFNHIIKKTVLNLSILLLIFSYSNIFSQTGKIKGKVTDATNGDVLPGSNLIINKSSIGAATDFDGNFIIYAVPVGTHMLTISYLGYKEKQIEITILENRTIEIDVALEPLVLEGDEVIISAQASAQQQAINQQLTSKTIKNIVSKKQIDELPEANAAEAVGRLPGVSLERSGGEGNKLVIRGMAPKYSLIQIDGVTMAATGNEDRSTDLSMISPYMLEGIELTKSVMANQEATATGGIVNFRIKKAPKDLTLNAIAQGGYNGLRDTYNDFKVSTGASNRFFENVFGIYAQVDYEEANRGSQQLGGVNFSQDKTDAPVRTNSMQLMDIYRDVQRIGATMVMDLAWESTEIKFSNFFSRINREETTFTNSYNFSIQGFSINLRDTPERSLTILTNSLQIDHRWRNLEINASFSHSFSENILPAQISSNNNNSPSNPFSTERPSNFNVDLDPESIPNLLTISKDEAVNFMHFGNLEHEESETFEQDLTGELNFSYNFNITNDINIKLNYGGKYRHKEKEYDRIFLKADNSGGNQEFRDLVYNSFEDELSIRTKDAWAVDDQRILLIDFLDKDYDGGEFLDNKYDFGYVFDVEKYRRIHDIVMDTYDPIRAVQDAYAMLQQNFINTNYQDFFGNEDYSAFYIMPEINFGSDLLFVPGVRYEANQTEYTGYRGNRLGVLAEWRATPIDTVTKVRNNDFILPMIQLFYKPTDWLTLKSGYTHTLQRPNFNNIMPGWVISNQGQIGDLSNFRLKPEKSENLDLQMSVHSDKIGLISFGAFHKRITDMIFWTGTTVITDTAFFELPSLMNRQRAAFAINNPNEAINFGFEIEYQSNFWFLPGILNGLVVNINYTRNKSEAKYLRSVVKSLIDPVTFRATLISEDTTYTSPMIGQPDHLLNLTIGYDYEGFSIRWAVRYTSRIFKSANWFEALRAYSSEFIRYDIAIKQKLPVDGMELFFNVNNLTNEVENDIINHLNFSNYIEDYGRTANLGIRYQF